VTKTEPQTIQRVLVPIVDATDERALVSTASVLADWFGASLQIIINDHGVVDRWETISLGTGVMTEPVVAVDHETFLVGAAAHAHAVAPSLCVIDSAERGLELSKLSDQAVFVPNKTRRSHRIATGPLVVPVSGHKSEMDALAVAAIWALALEIGVRLVASSDLTSDDEVEEHQQRLRQMGVNVGVDRAAGELTDAALSVAQSRKALAVVVSSEWPEVVEFVPRARWFGQSTVLAPSFDDATLAAHLAIELSDSGPVHRSTPPQGLVSMVRADCLARIEDQNVGRVAYVEDGWPVIVPVNYTAHEGAIMIRSLPGGKVEAAHRREIVCLEIDGFDEQNRHGWSVLAHGHLEVIADQAALRIAWEHDPDPWVDGGDWFWLRIVPLSVTGRTIRPATGLPETQ
jgi:hypothetical protein